MAARLDFVDLTKGETWKRRFQLRTAAGVVIPLDGYSVRMNVKANRTAVANLFALDSDGNGIDIDLTNDWFTVTLTDEQTETLPGRMAYYDLKLALGTEENTYLKGWFKYVPGATP